MNWSVGKQGASEGARKDKCAGSVDGVKLAGAQGAVLGGRTRGTAPGEPCTLSSDATPLTPCEPCVLSESREPSGSPCELAPCDLCPPSGSPCESAPSTPSRKGVDSFALKLIAIVAMTANHVAYIFDAVLPTPALFIMYTVGGLTFPIMAFLLVVGYKHTSNVRKYMVRLAIFALASQVLFQLFLAERGNVLITLLLSLVALYLYDTLRSRGVFWLIFAGIVAVSGFCDWGMIGPIMVLLMYILPSKIQRVAYPIVLVMAASGFPALMEAMAKSDLMMVPFALYAFIGCGADIPLLLAYNGQRGRSMKWFFYAYYPLHIAILGIAKTLLVG